MKESFTNAMGERYLTIKDIFKTAYVLMNERFGAYLALAVIVYLPINLIVQFMTMQVDTSFLASAATIDITSPEIGNLLTQLGKAAGTQLLMFFVELIAILVTAVIAHNQLFGERKLPFGRAFYLGIRMWPRGAITLFFVLVFFLLAIALMSGFMLTVFMMMMMVIPLILLAVVNFIMYQNCLGTVAALRGRFGFDNLRYINTVMGERRRASLGQFALIMLVTEAITLGINLLCGSMMNRITNVWAWYGVSVAVGTALSLLNIFGFLCGTVLFMGIEEYRRVQSEKQKQRNQEYVPPTQGGY